VSDVVRLARRTDIDLGAFRRVAWEGAGVELDAAALTQIGERRARFEAFLAAHPDRRFYGINVHAGDGSHRALDDEGRRDYARGMRSAVSFGGTMPRRVVRGIVLARLANFVEGESAVTPGLATAVAGMLDGRTLPDVPAHGNGGSGEIAPLGALFGELGTVRELALKESMSLVNGSPCAAALVADAALCASDLIDWAQRLFGLAALAYGVGPAIYDARLDQLWGDPFQVCALTRLREQLPSGSAATAGHVQPPVSYRIIPRVVGNALRVLDAAETVATTSLSAVSDNPTLLFDGDELVDIVSTGGFHNGAAAPAIDALGATMADLAALALHQLHRLQESREALPRFDSTNLGIVQMAANGYAEEARGACVPSLLGLGGRGQNDVPSPSFIAFDRYARVHALAAGALACLACLAAQSLAQTERPIPAALAETHAAIAAISPPLAGRRSLGPELAEITALLLAGLPG
jgi:histidine ammonia-lyase